MQHRGRRRLKQNREKAIGEVDEEAGLKNINRASIFNISIKSYEFTHILAKILLSKIRRRPYVLKFCETKK